MTVNLGNAVRFWSGWSPDAIALIFGDRHVTWRQFDERTSRPANGLRAIGIGRRDRVGIVAQNCVEYLELVVAGFKLGSVTVPLNLRLTPPELRYIIANANCTAVVADPNLAQVTADALDGLDNSITRIGLADGFGTPLAALIAADATDPRVDVGPHDLAFICYTSGTSGRPKGAMLTHNNVLAMATNRLLADNMTSLSRQYLPFPLAFTGDIISTFAPIYVAGGMLVLDDVVDPKRILTTIQDHRITIFNTVTVIFQMMIRNPDFATYDLSSLEVAVTGGAAVPGALLVEFMSAGIPVAQAYGLTEGGGINTWLKASEGPRRLGSCGRPLLHTEVRTVRPDARRLVDTAPGEVGELIVRGPEVMVGYWEDPDATSDTLVDGWLRTGDLAIIDDEGYVYIVDRAKDMIISGGLNIYPAEIEAVLSAIDGVAECAVIGVPDDTWGETPAALGAPVR